MPQYFFSLLCGDLGGRWGDVCSTDMQDVSFKLMHLSNPMCTSVLLDSEMHLWTVGHWHIIDFYFAISIAQKRAKCVWLLLCALPSRSSHIRPSVPGLCQECGCTIDAFFSSPKNTSQTQGDKKGDPLYKDPWVHSWLGGRHWRCIPCKMLTTIFIDFVNWHIWQESCN